MKRLVICVIAGWVAGSGVALADTYLQGVGDDHARPFKHDRFYSGGDKAFIGEPFDWSGVGQASDGKWATMISPRYFVSAAHHHPSGGHSLTFYEGNSTSGSSHTYTTDSWGFTTSMDGESSDLWLGRLTNPIPPEDNITYYSVLALDSDSDYIAREIYVYGVPNRVGRNNIDDIDTLYDEEDPDLGRTRIMVFGFNATGGTGEDEAYVMSGDSGAPSFSLHDNALALLGTHFANEGDPADGKLCGDSFVPYYIDQLNANMSGESVTVVPEPMTVALLLPALVALIGRGKRG